MLAFDMDMLAAQLSGRSNDLAKAYTNNARKFNDRSGKGDLLRLRRDLARDAAPEGERAAPALPRRHAEERPRRVAGLPDRPRHHVGHHLPAELQHAAAFGFRMTYPRNNAQGIVYEPWHWAWLPAEARGQRSEVGSQKTED